MAKLLNTKLPISLDPLVKFLLLCITEWLELLKLAFAKF